jgi:DNA-binding MarR family transcriptional regulator
MYNLRTGKEYNNQQKALALLKQYGRYGLTWKELSDKTDMHHGTASGVLSVLHKSGAILRGKGLVRNRCKLYFDISLADKIANEPYVNKNKSCPNCGHTL